jgi:hypothetical protein
MEVLGMSGYFQIKSKTLSNGFFIYKYNPGAPPRVDLELSPIRILMVKTLTTPRNDIIKG